MGHETRKGRGWMLAGAVASAFTMQPAAFRDSASAQTAGGVSYEALAQRPGGNYIRSTDADTRAQVLTRLGEAPFAASRPEAFANLEQAVDALMTSENIPAQYRAQILATIRGNANFTNYNIRGVAPDEMSSTEVVDAMLSRDGHVIGSGVGQNVRMETPVVPGTRTGHTGYRAERWVVEAVIDGRQVLMVFTRPEECNNFSVKIIDREQAPVARTVEAAPCLQIRVRPPRNVNFTNESVRAHVVMLDLGRGGTLPVEQCLSQEQVQVNCEDACSNMMLDAAQNSAPYRDALRKTMRERGDNATISRIYSPDADYTPDPEGGYITLPVRADQVNENVVFIVCFDWENGGSSVVTITEPVAGQNGVLEDQLIMNGAGQNMTVFRGGRRVSRPERQ